MIRKSISLLISLVVLVIVAYFVFMVPIGNRTVFEHLSRIADTDEAQEFGRDVAGAGQALGENVEESIDERLDVDAGDGAAVD